MIFGQVAFDSNYFFDPRRNGVIKSSNILYTDVFPDKPNFSQVVVTGMDECCTAL